MLLLAPTSTNRPNIILVLADDLGLSRMSCYGGAPFQTPNLDQLASQGVRFERAYSMPICGPSRAALLTGKYPFRTGAIDNNSSEIEPQKNPTIALLLKQAGYATCAIGKLGQSAPEDDAHAPPRLGFDESMLWMGRGTPDRYWNPRYQRNSEVAQGKPTEYGPDLTHEFLVDFMERHRTQPFFVYYSAVLTHEPLTRTPDSKDNAHLIQDMVSYQDKLMRRLANDLDRLALRTNTIILFTSDNGPDRTPLGSVRGAPMVGKKGDVGEGGVRTPLIVNCPALVPPGRVCPDLTDFTDLLPTVLELAQVKLPNGLHLDGRSIAPQILGQPGKPRDWVYAQHGDRYFIADQHYKLYGDGRFVDISDSPIAEIPITSPDAPAMTSKQRLAKELAGLRAGFPGAPRRKAAALKAKASSQPAEPATQLKADLQVLQAQKIIASSEEWFSAATTPAGCDGEQMARLLLQAANKFKPASSTDHALDILKTQGIVSAVAYWKKHAVPGGKCSGSNVARFIEKLARTLEAK